MRQMSKCLLLTLMSARWRSVVWQDALPLQVVSQEIKGNVYYQGWHFPHLFTCFWREFLFDGPSCAASIPSVLYRIKKASLIYPPPPKKKHTLTHISHSLRGARGVCYLPDWNLCFWGLAGIINDAGCQPLAAWYTDNGRARALRCISETQLRGITGVWSCKSFYLSGPPPEKARLLHLATHLERDSMKHRSHNFTLNQLEVFHLWTVESTYCIFCP